MRKFLGAALAILGGMFMPLPVSAATPAPNTGVTVRPAITSVVVQPGQLQQSFTETLENDTSQPVTIAPTASDFGTTGVNGAIDLKTLPDTAHGLAANLQFAPGSITLAKGESRTITVRVSDASGLGPGGHFAAIRYRVVTDSSNGKSTVGLSSELLSFVFLTTIGRASYGVSLTASLPHIVLWQPPAEADLLFTNTANTQTAPHGVVNVSGPRRSQVVNAIINPDSALVLPGSTRLFQTPLRRVRAAVLPGWYSVDIYYRPTGSADYQHQHQRYFFIGWPVLLLVVCVAAALYMLVRLLRKKRRPPTSLVPPSNADAPAPASKRRSIPVKHL